jgi:hypothetical protein
MLGIKELITFIPGINIQHLMSCTGPPLSLLILCKLSFPVGGLKMSSISTLAMKYPNKIFVLVFTVFIEYAFKFLIEAVLHINSFTFCWA